MSSTNSIALQIFSSAQRLLTNSVYIVFTVGTIGNAVCILIFLSLKPFRHHRCTFYLIIDCICSSLILFTYFIHEMINLSVGMSEGVIVLIWCKTRVPSSQILRLILCSMVCFQAIDQYCSTHHRYAIRQLFSLSVGKFWTIVTTFVWIGQAIPFVIYDEIVPYVGCIVLNKWLNDYYSFFYTPILQGLLPICIASTFSLLAYRNVRRIVRRQIPIERRRLDRQITAMLLSRVFLFVLFGIPFTVYRIILLNYQISNRDLYPFAISQLILTITAFFMNLVYMSNLYIFLVISSRFRRQAKCFLIKRCFIVPKNLLFARTTNIVQPFHITSALSRSENDLE